MYQLARGKAIFSQDSSALREVGVWNVEPAVAVEPDMAALGMGPWNVEAAVMAKR